MRARRPGLTLLLLACGCASDAVGPTTGPLEGSWGGSQATLVVDEDGARVELTCADGRIDGRILLERGRFDATGPWWPGPVPPGEPQTARYSGVIDGGSMELTILADGTRSYGPLTLVRDREPTFPRCQ
jgi:hypothetical protein